MEVGQWVNLSLNNADTDALVIKIDGTYLDVVYVSDGIVKKLTKIPHYKDTLVTRTEKHEYKSKKGVVKSEHEVIRRTSNTFWRD
jgi:hypothetical protein